MKKIILFLTSIFFLSCSQENKPKQSEISKLDTNSRIQTNNHVLHRVIHSFTEKMIKLPLNINSDTIHKEYKYDIPMDLLSVIEDTTKIPQLANKNSPLQFTYHLIGMMKQKNFDIIVISHKVEPISSRFEGEVFLYTINKKGRLINKITLGRIESNSSNTTTITSELDKNLKITQHTVVTGVDEFTGNKKNSEQVKTYQIANFGTISH